MEVRGTVRSILAAVFCAGLSCVVTASGPATTEITRVEVQESGPMGSFGGREYSWVTAAMEGRAGAPATALPWLPHALAPLPSAGVAEGDRHWRCVDCDRVRADQLA